MKNVDMKVEGNALTITVDISKDYGESKSGKSITIASTEGNISIPGHEEIKIGLNIYRKNNPLFHCMDNCCIDNIISYQ